MTQNASAIPSSAALRIARKVGLLPQLGEPATDRLAMENLQQFELVSVTGSFKEALIAYEDVTLTAKQKKGLKKLYDVSRAYIRGYTLNCMLNIASSNNKDAVAAGKLVLEELMPAGEKAEADSTKYIVNVIQPSGN